MCTEIPDNMSIDKACEQENPLMPSSEKKIQEALAIPAKEGIHMSMSAKECLCNMDHCNIHFQQPSTDMTPSTAIIPTTELTPSLVAQWTGRYSTDVASAGGTGGQLLTNNVFMILMCVKIMA